LKIFLTDNFYNKKEKIMGFNIWNGNKNNRNTFQFDGWKKIENKKSNKEFIVEGWQNKAPKDKCLKAKISGWKNSISL
jgi:hypothetical protein